MKKKIKSIFLMLFAIFSQIKSNTIKITKWQYPENSNITIYVGHDIHISDTVENELNRYLTILKNLQNKEGQKIIFYESMYDKSSYLNEEPYQSINVFHSEARKAVFKNLIKTAYDQSTRREIYTSLLSFFKFDSESPLSIFEFLLNRPLKRNLWTWDNFDFNNIDCRHHLQFLTKDTIFSYMFKKIVCDEKNPEEIINSILSIFKTMNLQEFTIEKVEKILNEATTKIKNFMESETPINPNETTIQILSALNSEKERFVNFIYMPCEKLINQYINNAQLDSEEQKIYTEILNTLHENKLQSLEENNFNLDYMLEVNTLNKILQTYSEQPNEHITIFVYMGANHSSNLEKYLERLNFERIHEEGVSKFAKKILQQYELIEKLINEQNKQDLFNSSNFINLFTLYNSIQNIIHDICSFGGYYSLTCEEIDNIFKEEPEETNGINYYLRNVLIQNPFITSEIGTFNGKTFYWAADPSTTNINLIEINTDGEIFIRSITTSEAIQDYSSYKELLNYIKKLSLKRRPPREMPIKRRRLD